MIKKIYGRRNAYQATGTTVVIDVLRAATVEAFALSKGTKYIIPVSKINEAFNLKNDNPSYILIGEKDGYKVNGFDFGNSPSEIFNANLKNKILVHRTSSGTKALAAVVNAQEIIFGSFVTAAAIAKYLKLKCLGDISLLALEDDDSVCADYIESILIGNPLDESKVKKIIYATSASEWFRDSLKTEFPLRDLDLSLDFNRFNFICLVERAEGSLRTVRLNT